MRPEVASGIGRVDASPSRARAAADSIRSIATDPDRMLPLALLAALVVRIAWLAVPQNSLIFDEAYYVNAARILLGWPVPLDGQYAGSPLGLDPNVEHPPLGKLILAASMLVFGDNGVGWRVPSVIAGMAALGAVYGIVRAAGETARLGVLVVCFLALENLMLVHSRIGTLDMLFVAPTLIGAWLALRRRFALSGLLIGVALLVKLTAVYALIAIVALFLVRVVGAWRRERGMSDAGVRPLLVIPAVAVVVFLGGLSALDARFTAYRSPIEHVAHMVEYGANLRSPVDRAGICATNDSPPWEWLFNECQITYLRVDVTVRSGDEVISKVPSIDFRGAMNPLLAGAIPLAMLFATWMAWRSTHELSRWVVAWAAANWLPYVVLAFVNHRITYIYYILPAVPAIAMAVAILLTRSGLPRFILTGFVAAYVLGFVAYFPFRSIP
jgi:4-amino-4-deoxy-L-arabinose transferase-like glycosyltransferase